MPFDPDAYLNTAGSSFDPDAYLGTQPEPQALAQPEGPSAQEVWSKAGGALPDLGKLKEYYVSGLSKFAKDPLGTAFPMATQAGEDGNMVKANVLAALDVLAGADRLINFASGGAMEAGKKAAQSLVPEGESGIAKTASETAKGLIDVGTDLSTYVGAGTFKKAGETLAERSARLAAKEAGTTTAKGIKQAVAGLNRLDADLLEDVATKPEYLKRLKNAAISEGAGGFDELVDSVRRKVNSINLDEKVAARAHIDDINVAMDDHITRAVKQADDGITAALEFTPEKLSKSARGSTIADAVDQSREAIGKAFGEGQEKYMNVVGDTPLPTRKVITKAADTGEEVLKTSNTIQDQISSVLEKSGYDGKSFRGVEKFDNVPALPADVKDAEYFLQLAGKAENTKDAVNQLRLLRKLKGSMKPDGTFYNAKMLGQIDDGYQKAIADQLDASGVEGLSDLWRATNSAYRDKSKILSDVNKGLSVGKVPSERYVAKIKNLGVEKLVGIKNAAANDDALSVVWDEVQKGFMDDVVSSSLDASGNLDIKKLKKVWGNIDNTDPLIKKTLVPSERISAIDDAINRFDATEKAAEAARKKVSGLSKRIEKTTSAFTESPEFLAGDAAQQRIKNVGQKTAAARKTRNTLDILDQFYGTDFAQRAEDMFNARQLSISDAGTLPFTPVETSGRSLLGVAITKSLKLFDKIPVVGDLLSTAAGIAGVSPGGAVAIYKALNTAGNTKRALMQGVQLITPGQAATIANVSRNLQSRE